MVTEKKMKSDESNLVKLKEEYEKLKQKYSLPEFKFMNENFEIEQICVEDTELLLKRIRKQTMDKISSGIRGLEMFLNPQNAPVFIFNIIKTFSQPDKEIIDNIYHKFAEFEIQAFGLENKYNEEAEADFVKKVAKEWIDICDDFDRLFKSMRANYKQESKKNEKSYLG